MSSEVTKLNSTGETETPEDSGDESEYERAWREFTDFITDETITDRWSRERIEERDMLIGQITAAAYRKHGLTTPGDNATDNSLQK